MQATEASVFLRFPNVECRPSRNRCDNTDKSIRTILYLRRFFFGINYMHWQTIWDRTIRSTWATVWKNKYKIIARKNGLCSSTSMHGECAKSRFLIAPHWIKCLKLAGSDFGGNAGNFRNGAAVWVRVYDHAPIYAHFPYGRSSTLTPLVH